MEKYAQFGDQNLKKEKKKIPREESSRKEEMVINVRRGPTVQIIKVKWADKCDGCQLKISKKWGNF